MSCVLSWDRYTNCTWFLASCSRQGQTWLHAQQVNTKEGNRVGMKQNPINMSMPDTICAEEPVFLCASVWASSWLCAEDVGSRKASVCRVETGEGQGRIDWRNRRKGWELVSGGERLRTQKPKQKRDTNLTPTRDCDTDWRQLIA